MTPAMICGIATDTHGQCPFVKEAGYCPYSGPGATTRCPYGCPTWAERQRGVPRRANRNRSGGFGRGSFWGSRGQRHSGGFWAARSYNPRGPTVSGFGDGGTCRHAEDAVDRAAHALRDIPGFYGAGITRIGNRGQLSRNGRLALALYVEEGAVFPEEAKEISRAVGMPVVLRRASQPVLHQSGAVQQRPYNPQRGWRRNVVDMVEYALDDHPGLIGVGLGASAIIIYTARGHNAISIEEAQEIADAFDVDVVLRATSTSRPLPSARRPAPRAVVGYLPGPSVGNVAIPNYAWTQGYPLVR